MRVVPAFEVDGTLDVVCRVQKIETVEFAEFSASGKLRQASFEGIREDKSAEDLRAEGG